MFRLNCRRTLFIQISFLTLVLAGTSIQSDVRAESDSFPEYTSIQPNVNFWAKIYTKYGSDHGVIHDKRNMNIIYGVIELVDPDRYRDIIRQGVRNLLDRQRAEGSWECRPEMYGPRPLLFYLQPLSHAFTASGLVAARTAGIHP